MLAKSSNQLTFSWQSNGGTTSVERTQYQVELKTRKGKKETCIYIYIYIAVTHFSRVTVLGLTVRSIFAATWLKRG